MKVGLNLFGMAKSFTDNLLQDAYKIKSIGFTSVEPMIFFVSDLIPAENHDKIKLGLGQQAKSIWLDTEADEKIMSLKESGLLVQSVHIFGLGNLGDSLDKMIPSIVTFGRKHNIRYFVSSYSNATLDKLKPFLPSFNRLADALAANNMQLVFHNHDLELKSDKDLYLLDYVMKECPNVKLELDVGWVQFAGESPLKWMRKYKDRIVLLHLKDICEDASKENRSSCFRAIGEGCIPLDEILQEASFCSLDEHGIVIDQDDSIGDMYTDLKNGMHNILTSASKLR